MYDYKYDILKGLEPAVLFQAHMDVVAAVDDGVEFNYTTDSIKLRRECWPFTAAYVVYTAYAQKANLSQ